MTPDEARALLAGTTPGPWEVNPKHPGDGLSPDELARAQADAALIAAAPALAAMIAEMREEWGIVPVYPGLHEVEEWEFDTREEAEAEGIDRGDEYRVARRYVTEPEEA